MKSPSQQVIMDWIKKTSHSINPGSRILDLGCGNGLYTKFFANSHSKLIGLDLNNVVRKEWQNLFTFLYGDGTQLPFHHESFDVIISFDVIEHVEKDGLFMKEISRVLKKKGRCIIGTPNRWRLTNRILASIGKERKYPLFLGTSPLGLGDIIHVREYTDSELINVTQQAGLNINQIDHLWLGTCLPPFELGLKRFPQKLGKYSQYLMMIASK